MQAPVTDIAKDVSFFINLNDTTFIKLGDNRREILFGTTDNTLRLVRNMSEVAKAVEGTNFVKLEQGFVVNMERATRLDSEYNILHFKSSGLEGIDQWYVSRDNLPVVKRFMR